MMIPSRSFFCFHEYGDTWFLGIDKQNGSEYTRVEGKRVIFEEQDNYERVEGVPEKTLVVDIPSTSISDNRWKSVNNVRVRQGASIPANVLGNHRQLEAGEIYLVDTAEFDFKTNSWKFTSVNSDGESIFIGRSQCIPIEFEFAPTPTDFENFLNINVAWGKSKKVEFIDLSRCSDDMRSSSIADDERISVYHEYFCRNGFVRETSPLGIQNCELEKVTAEKEDDLNTRDMSDARMGVTEYEYQKGECRWQNKE